MVTRTWTPAKLIIIEPKTSGPETKLWEMEFPFNPKDFSITRAADWSTPQGKQGVLPEYAGPKQSSVTLEMFLDETESENGDISRTVKKLLEALIPESKSKQKKKPTAPLVRFIWGTAIEFKGYLEQIAVKYTLFRENGNPVRGTATLTLKEYVASPARQNPTSGGEPGSAAHEVIAGDTLPSIAYREYGTANAWRRIADANPLVDDPMRLRPGTTLVIPPA